MMELYKGQLKDADFDIKENVKVPYCRDIFTFDIEVTSAWMYKGQLIPYTPGKPAEFWNDLDKYALPYIWQFSFNDKVFYGRELQSFLQVLDDMPKAQCWIYVHNLAYEQVFLQNILYFDKLFARSPHKPMKCSSREYPHIEFRCSYVLTNMSLASWGDQLGVKKLTGELDYLKMRTPLTDLSPQEMAYCEMDVRVCYAGIRDHLSVYKDVKHIPLTSTGKVRKVVKKITTNDYEYMKEVKRLIPADCDQYMLWQRIFQGGYTHANRKYLDKTIRGQQIFHTDISSSYPFSLCAFKYPYNVWGYIGNRLPDPETFEHRAYIIKLHLKDVVAKGWNTYISASKCRGSGFVYDNGRILAADEIFYECTEMDYLTILNNYNFSLCESMGTYCCQKKYLPEIFIRYVLQLYGEKTSLKNIPEYEEQYRIAKTYINALFGMACTGIIMGDVVFIQDAFDQWRIEELTPQKVNKYFEKLRIWWNKKYFMPFTNGVWCTAFSRRRLWECIETMDSDLLYTDTDSLFFVGDHDLSWFNAKADLQLAGMCEHYGIDFELTRPKDRDGIKHPLGVMESEKRSGEIDAFRTLGAKKYIEEAKGKLYMTVAGINKGAVDCLNGDIENFRDGFVFDKDHPSVHKLEHTYLTDMQPVTWPDGYKSVFKYGINMRPTGYQLSKPNVYQDVADLLNGNVPISQDYDIKRRGIIL